MGAKNVKKNVFNIAAMLSAAFCFFLLPDMAFAAVAGLRFALLLYGLGAAGVEHQQVNVRHLHLRDDAPGNER